MSFEFKNFNSDDLNSNREFLRKTFAEFGVLVFPGFLIKNPLFINYRNDLIRALNVLLKSAGPDTNSSESLDIKLTNLAINNVEYGKFLADLGTQPNKLVSGNALKFSADFIKLAKICLGENSFLGTPAAGDTLHLFPPSEKFFKYNLPIHQDYQYLMQSPAQITFWINMGTSQKDNGGITVWLGSHTEGITTSRRNRLNQFECVIDEKLADKYPTFSSEAGEGDLIIMHSLLWHRSEKNISRDKSRIAQLFRFSDLNHEEAVKYRWQSTTYDRPSLQYEAVHTELFEKDRSI